MPFSGLLIFLPYQKYVVIKKLKIIF